MPIAPVMLAVPSKLLPNILRAVVKDAAVVAVDALPVNAPTKVVAVTVPVDGTNVNLVLLVLAD